MVKQMRQIIFTYLITKRRSSGPKSQSKIKILVTLYFLGRSFELVTETV